MYHSPLKTRSGKAVGDKTADKRKLERALSVDSAPATDSDMPSMDSTQIEACLTQLLSNDNIIDNLASKLVGRLEVIVRKAVADSMKAVLNEVATLQKTVASLETKVAELDTALLSRTDELEQYQRRNNIRVYGVPEVNGEDTDDVVVKLFREKLGVDVSTSCLDRSHRVGRKRASAEGAERHRPIIVRFTSYRDRRLVFSAKRKLKSTGLSIREDLTPTRLELLRLATDKFGISKTWSLDGRVMWLDSSGKKGVATKLADLSESS